MSTRYLAEFYETGDATATPARVAGTGAVPAPTASAPFAPPSIAGLQFWLRADDLDAALNDGDVVSTWEDRQNNHDFTAAGGVRPLFKTNIAASMPGVLFDGNDDYLNGGDLQSLFPSAATLFIVYQPISDAAWVLVRNNDTDTWWDFSGDGYLGTFRTARIANYPTGVPSSGRHSYALKSSSSTYRAYLDGVAQTAQSASYADGDGYFYLGGSPSDPQGQNRHLNGYIFEVVAYDTALSDADITSLETYAEALWSYSPNGLATPITVAGMGAVPAPSTVGAAIAAPATVVGTGAVPAPTAIGGADGLATPSNVAGVGAVPAPTAIGAAAGEATPNVVPGTGAVPASTATGNSIAAPATVAGIGAVPAATARGASSASPARVAGVGAVPAPTVFGATSATAMPGTVRGIGRVRPPFFPSGSGSGPPGSPVSAFWTIYLGPSDGGGA